MFFQKKVQSLTCPDCKSRLKIIKISRGQSNGIVKCNCDLYPLVSGIIYLNKVDQINRIIIDFIKKEKYAKALASLLSFSLSSKMFFYTTGRYPSIYKLLGYKNFITLLRFFSLPTEWVNYLKNREAKLDFLIRLLCLDLISNPDETVADLGCGTGSFFPYLYNHINPNSIIGIDISFLNLYIARLFFARRETLLICSDLDHGIPLQNSSIDIVFSADTLNYLKRLSLFLSEVKRIISYNGRVCITHVVNKNTTPSGLGINPKKIETLMKDSGLNYSLMSHKFMMQQLSQRKKAFFLQDNYLTTYHAYNIFLFKKNRPKYLSLTKRYVQYFREKDIIL